MTPWQLLIAGRAYNERRDAEHDQGVWMFYHAEALSRSPKNKRLPPMKRYLSESLKAPIMGIDENAIMGRLKSYQASRKSNEGSNPKR